MTETGGIEAFKHQGNDRGAQELESLSYNIFSQLLTGWLLSPNFLGTREHRTGLKCSERIAHE